MKIGDLVTYTKETYGPAHLDDPRPLGIVVAVTSRREDGLSPLIDVQFPTIDNTLQIFAISSKSLEIVSKIQ